MPIEAGSNMRGFESHPKLLVRISIALIIFLLCVYSAFFIYRSSVVIDGERYFSLFDDAMVSMRYASNIAAGNGFVWNPGGERVEGTTNLLWTLYMAFCHIIPIPQSKMALLIQLSGLLILIITVIVTSKTAAMISDNNSFLIIVSAFLTAFCYPLIFWTLRGMEVGLLTLLVISAVFIAIRASSTAQFSYIQYVLLGIAVLTRLDMVIPFCTILLFSALVDKPHRSKHVWIGLLILSLAVGSQALWRLYYFGECLPNTYYLKLTGFPLLPRLLRGLWVTLQWLVIFVPIAFLLPSAVLFSLNKHLGLLLAIPMAQGLYNIYVGGDAWERLGFANRYITIALPSIILLLAFTTDKLCFSEKPGNNLSPRSWLSSNILTKILAVVTVFFALNGLPYATSVQGMSLVKPLYVGYDIQKIREALWLRGITKSDATIAVYSAGTLPYFTHRHTIDILGKSDKYISRLPMRLPDDKRPGVDLYSKWRLFWPGHMKYDYKYSLGHLKPDVVQGLWDNEKEGASFLDNDYVKVDMGKTGGDIWLRKDSPNILWGNIDLLREQPDPNVL
jgi:arabinofuranosyltransferase